MVKGQGKVYQCSVICFGGDNADLVLTFNLFQKKRYKKASFQKLLYGRELDPCFIPE